MVLTVLHLSLLWQLMGSFQTVKSIYYFEPYTGGLWCDMVSGAEKALRHGATVKDVCLVHVNRTTIEVLENSISTETKCF